MCSSKDPPFLIQPTANRSYLSMTTLVLKGFWADVAHFLYEQSCTSNWFKRTKIHVPLTGFLTFKTARTVALNEKTSFYKSVPFKMADNAKWQTDKVTKWLTDSMLSFWQNDKMAKWLRIVVFFDQSKWCSVTTAKTWEIFGLSGYPLQVQLFHYKSD